MYRSQLPTTWVGEKEHLRKTTQAVNLLNDSISVRGEITLNAGSVVVLNDKIGEDAIAILQPKNAGAASTDWYAVVENRKVEFFFVGGVGGDFRYQIIL